MAKLWVYAGTSENEPGTGISRFRFDTDTGNAGRVELAAEATRPMFLAIHPNQRFLYAVNGICEFQGQESGAVSAFALDRETGELRLLNQQPSGGTEPCHLVVDREGRNVLVANYAGGSVACLPIEGDGKLKPPSSAVQHGGSSVNPSRQEGPHAHSINLDAANRFALVCDLGLDQILVYRFDPDRGTLTPHDPPTVSTAPGAGPRHLAFHPSGRFAYVINELDSTVTAFRYNADAGVLREIQTVDTRPFGGENHPAEVLVHVSGRFLYRSSHGADNIVIHTIDAQTGRLGWSNQAYFGGRGLCNFNIDASGRWMVMGNQRTHNGIVLRIDAKRGKLTHTGQEFEAPSPSCFKLVRACGAAGETEADMMPALHEEADALIRAMYLGRVGWGARERARELKLGAVFAAVRSDAGASAALHRLIYGLPDAGCLAAIEPVLGSLGPQAGNTGLDALLYFALGHERWRRAPEEWSPDTEDRRGQVGSLARHLFCRYPVPAFLDAAWLSGPSPLAEAQREWFVHLGTGGKLEAIHFPLPMTHRAAHHFLLAPEDFTLIAALRYGQIRALGGSETLARAVAETFLAEPQSDEPFWFSVIHFLANHPELPTVQIGPILDYVRFRKFGFGGSDAPEPEFSMKGRTVDALLKRMDEWHAALARLGKGGRQTWGPCGIAPLERTEKDPLSSATCTWRLLEITDTMALAEEGRAMRHCVRSYQTACIKGESSIWSMRVTFAGRSTVRRLLTIEVNMHRRSIVQVRGNCNQTLSAMRGRQRMRLARTVLRDWARQHHLGIACSL